MTYTIKYHLENGYYVSLEWDKSNIYVVEVCQQFKGSLCGYPIRRMTYPINDIKNAQATYRRYIRKYCKGAEK